MEEQFQLLFDNMKMEMQKQTAELTESLTKNLMDRMDEKLTPIIEENEQLKQKVSDLEKEMEYLKREKKKEIPLPPSRLVLVGDKDHNPPTIQKNNYKDTKIYVAALNVLTLKNEENLIELTNALNKIKWDIVGLSEVRRMGERIISQPDFLLYHIGTTPGHHGVGFIVKKYLEKSVEEFIGISERIAMMNLKLPGYKDSWSIVQIYSPTEQSDLETIEEFYLDLNNTIQERAHNNLIVMGDFNGQIGAKRPGEETKIT
ncbi:uncharacterized protein LOC119630581 [Bombyx mori]|uniref:uncharacterized protein LOC119630581 n=1 Tax=Bombyx mori TaxID=7091 RepID=UPI002ED1E4C3